MAFYSGAQQREISVNFNKGGNAPRLLIVHIMQGTLAGSDSWFRNPQAQVSAHFGTGKDGTVYQWVDTDSTAWHAADANTHSIGVENEGNSGDKLTDAQIEAIAKIYVWAHAHYPAISMWLATQPAGSGLAYHALGGTAWGGHPQCPGIPIQAQLPEIEARAKAILNPAPPSPPPPVQDGFLVVHGAVAGALTGRAVTSHDSGKTWA